MECLKSIYYTERHPCARFAMEENMKTMTLFTLICLIIACCPYRLTHAADTNGMKETAAGNNAFAADLYQALRARPGNLLFSPYSIFTALAMTYAGARGSTEQEMAAAVHFPYPQNTLHARLAGIQSHLSALETPGYIRLRVANSLWLQQGLSLLPAFTQVLQDAYASNLKHVDFATNAESARESINTWVENKTNGKIGDLIKPGVLSALTRLVLCNAIYLKAPWAEQFHEGNTKREPFHLSANKEIQVDMMHQVDTFRYKDFATFTAIELPYSSTGKPFGRPGDPSMIVLLPKTIDGLAALERAIGAEILQQRLQELHETPAVKVILKLPRFKTTQECQLADILSRLGMPGAFRADRADFSGMTGAKDLFISAIIHKAFIDVNEKGTEAAAATAVVMAATAARPLKPKEPERFIADHPFMFLIRDNQSGAILFMGRIVDPTQ